MKSVRRAGKKKMVRQRIVRRKSAKARAKAQKAKSTVQQSEIPKYEKGGNTKIAFVQPASFGDNINSTLMFKPLRKHFKDCLLDVHTSTRYGDVFKYNPLVNEIVYHKANTKQESLHLCHTIPPLLAESNYDHILVPHPMVNPSKWQSSWNPEWGENLILAWVNALEKMGVQYDIPLETMLFLSDEEKKKVRQYLARVPGLQTRRNILIEIEGESGQTFWDPNWTIKVGEFLLDENTNLFMSHHTMRGDIQHLQDRNRGFVHWVGEMNIRECAEIFNFCDAFISVSSGLSNACNTNWCKNSVKWFEVVNSRACSSAAIREDGKVFWHKNDISAFIGMLKDKLPKKKKS